MPTAITIPFSATILTLFPEMFPGPLGDSIIGRALKENHWQLNALQIRDYAADKHHTVDDTPYGGGAGMVMKADVIAAALDAAIAASPPNPRLIYMSPRGRVLNQPLVKELSGQPLIILCGRYEGVDERVIDHYGIEEISIGDYVLAGGEVAAMVLLEACVRLLPGVMGEEASAMQESFGLDENYAGLLEYPHYTKPPSWKGLEVPEVLLSGHHRRIEEWRKEKAIEITRQRRPDLLQQAMRCEEQKGTKK